MEYIWAVSGEAHGIVSYWDSKEKGLEEAKKICEKEYRKPFEITEEEESYVEIINGLVNVARIKLNKSWV
jgi:hypothetical protein